MKKFALILCLLFTPALFAQDKPVTPVKPPTIRFPVIVAPVAPVTPIPDVKPGNQLPLSKETAFVFDSDVPVFLKFFPASKASLVKVTEDAGPISKMKYRFADDPTKFQVRSFTGKYVYTIEPAGVGVVDLVAIPSGLTTATDVQAQCLSVDDGSGQPKPVPVPPTPVDPVDPPAPSTPLSASVQAAYTSDVDPTKAISAPRLAFVYEDMVRASIDDPALKTWNDFLRELIDKRKAAVGDGLVQVRQAIDTEFKAKFPPTTTTFDSAGRVLAKTVLTNAATALKGVK